MSGAHESRRHRVVGWRCRRDEPVTARGDLVAGATVARTNEVLRRRARRGAGRGRALRRRAGQRQAGDRDRHLDAWRDLAPPEGPRWHPRRRNVVEGDRARRLRRGLRAAARRSGPAGRRVVPLGLARDPDGVGEMVRADRRSEAGDPRLHRAAGAGHPPSRVPRRGARYLSGPGPASGHRHHRPPRPPIGHADRGPPLTGRAWNRLGVGLRAMARRPTPGFVSRLDPAVDGEGRVTWAIHAVDPPPRGLPLLPTLPPGRQDGEQRAAMGQRRRGELGRGGHHRRGG